MDKNTLKILQDILTDIIKMEEFYYQNAIESYSRVASLRNQKKQLQKVIKQINEIR